MYSECTKDELIARIQSLEKENHFYKCLMDAFPVNVFVKDTDCRYTITSRKCDELNGVERGGLKGKTDFDIQGSRDVAQSFYEDDQQILRDKVGSRMFSPAVCGESVKYFDIFKEPILDEDGNISLEKLEPIVYSPTDHKYYKIGEKVGNAFSDGKKLV